MPGLADLFGSKLAMARFFRECQRLIADGSPRAPLCLDHPGEGLLVSFSVDGEERPSMGSYRDMRVLPKHVPNGDTLRSEIKRLLVDRRGTLHSKWIVKPQESTFLSRGIHVAALDHRKDLADDAAFFAWLSSNFKPPKCFDHSYSSAFCRKRRVTFQQYVEGSLAFKRKFDVRTWVLIASLDPLRVYVLRHGYPKISSKLLVDPATNKEAPLEDLCVRVKMLLDPECGGDLASFEEGFEPDGFPKTTASYSFANNLEFGPDAAFPAVASEPNATKRQRTRDILGAHAWPKLEEIFTKVLMRSRDALLAARLDAEYDEVAARRRASGLEDDVGAPRTRRRSLLADGPPAAFGFGGGGGGEDSAEPHRFPRRRSFSDEKRPEAEKKKARARAREKVRRAANATAVGLNRARAFALLSPDVVLDGNGDPHLEEINANGFVMGTHDRAGGARDLFTDMGYFEALLRIVGADGYPNAPRYEEALDAAICAFCGVSTGPGGPSPACAEDEVAAIKVAVHEEAHAGPNWYRLYPPIPCRGAACAPPEPGAPDGLVQFPEQFKLLQAHLDALEETRLDTVVREFLSATDTAAIHGSAAVPGHARWPPHNADVGPKATRAGAGGG